MCAKSFKDLDIWQRSIRLVGNIYELTRSFPKEELYGLSAQLRRAAVSIHPLTWQRALPDITMPSTGNSSTSRLEAWPN
ncbi:MAG: four helix bundle protein [Planctomycetota bacterium]